MPASRLFIPTIPSMIPGFPASMKGWSSPHTMPRPLGIPRLHTSALANQCGSSVKQAPELQLPW